MGLLWGRCSEMLLLPSRLTKCANSTEGKPEHARQDPRRRGLAQSTPSEGVLDVGVIAGARADARAAADATAADRVQTGLHRAAAALYSSRAKAYATAVTVSFQSIGASILDCLTGSEVLPSDGLIDASPIIQRAGDALGTLYATFGVYTTTSPLVTGNDAQNITGDVYRSGHTVADAAFVTGNTKRGVGVAGAGPFTDGFTGPDGAIAGRTTDTGSQTWVVADGSGTPSIVSNSLGCPDWVSGVPTAYVVNNVADGVLQATCTNKGSTSTAAMMFRRQGSGSFYELAARESAGSLVWALFSRTSGAAVLVAATTIASANGDVVRVECAGSTVTVKINGVTGYSGTLATWATNGRWGFGFRDTTARWDNVSFV